MGKKIIEEKIEMYSITCLLENGKKAFIEMPENIWDEGYDELMNKIKGEDFFDAEFFGGSTDVDGVYINSLNCKKVMGLIY